MAIKVGNLENKVREMDEREKARKVERQEMVNICKLTYINIHNGDICIYMIYIYFSIYVLK